ncbi:extracellular solute-binding protein [Gammaproteobacteria bacterium]|nr:extracellular solute-binding protein [Gammaproteobacteria bacterium]
MQLSLKHSPLVALLAMTTIAHAELTFVSWGGAYAESQQKAYVDTYLGANINFLEYDGGLDEIRNQVNTGQVTWDIVDVQSHEARVGCDEGLFEELDRDMFEKAADGTAMDDDIMVQVPNDCVVPQVFWSHVVFYQQGSFVGTQPSTIADFFDLHKFPGKRGLRSWPQGLIEMALIADGVTIRNVYKVMSTDAGINQAFRLLDRIKGDVVFWSTGKEPLELVKSGKVSMSLAYSGRVGSAVLNTSEKFVTLWDGQVLDAEWLVIVKGAPNLEGAMKFLVHASAPAQQAGQARHINYGPMRASAFDIIRSGEPWFHNGKNILQHMPNRPEVMARSIVANPEWWADYGAAIEERYLAWMATAGS